MISEDSPLMQLPAGFSHRQILLFDGLRYATDIADIAYKRLGQQLQKMDVKFNQDENINSEDIAVTFLDAWSIIDAVYRFRKLIHDFPSLPNSTWKRLFLQRTEDVESLRDGLQHQDEKIPNLITNKGQIWGYLSWAEVNGGRHTGKWRALCPGHIRHDSLVWVGGPAAPSRPLPTGRIKLNAFGKIVYLGECIRWMKEAVGFLEGEITSGNIGVRGDAARDISGRDLVIEMAMQVAYEDNTSG